MARPVKRRVSPGRITPKGTHPENYTPERTSHTGLEELPPSPIWVPILLFTFLGLGVATIIVNYLGILWDTSNAILLAGLGLILAGLVTATKFR